MKITVEADDLREVLRALVGPGYLIRELQATMHPTLFPDNPIMNLLRQYNEQIATAPQSGVDRQ